MFADVTDERVRVTLALLVGAGGLGRFGGGSSSFGRETAGGAVSSSSKKCQPLPLTESDNPPERVQCEACVLSIARPKAWKCLRRGRQRPFEDERKLMTYTC